MVRLMMASPIVGEACKADRTDLVLIPPYTISHTTCPPLQQETKSIPTYRPYHKKKHIKKACPPTHPPTLSSNTPWARQASSVAGVGGTGMLSMRNGWEGRSFGRA